MISDTVEQIEGFYILIDYDNVRSYGSATREATELLLEDLWRQLAYYVSKEYPSIIEIDVLLYGGWLDERGSYSDLASWLRALISSFRGLRSGLRFRPVLVEHLISCPHLSLVGTVRTRKRGLEQKMVDTMLCCDLIHLSREMGNFVTVVSDDDDFVPASIYGSLKGQSPITLLRNRSKGSGINDKVLSASGVRIVEREVIA